MPAKKPSEPDFTKMKDPARKENPRKSIVTTDDNIA